MDTYSESVRKEYQENYLEDARLIDLAELPNENGYSCHFYDKLQDSVVDGIPVGSDLVSPLGEVADFDTVKELSDEERAKYRLRYHYLPNAHEIYIGTTGSGKTTGCIEPTLRAISTQKNKPNLFLTDPKGELFDRNAQHLKKMGYRLYMLNFKDFGHTHHWNPLDEVYEMKMKTLQVGKGAEYRQGEVPANLALVFPKEMYNEQGYFYYDGKAFPTKEDLIGYIEVESDSLNATIDDLVNQLANMFIHVNKASKEPSWEYGAVDLLAGVLLCMLDDAVNYKKTGFTREMMNIRTVQAYYTHIRETILSSRTNYDRGINLVDVDICRGKPEAALSRMKTALDNAPNTMRSYCGVFDGAMKDWFQGHIYALTADSNIKLDFKDDSPFAIFIITRDYEKSDFRVAGLFIDWVYRKALEHAESCSIVNGYCQCRALHFILDEFGNIPEIKDFENKIATARSRNIWFHLSLQSYAQIEVVYDAEKSKRSVIISDNCNSHLFLGAQNQDTKVRFSEQCGNHYVDSYESTFNPAANALTKVPLVPVSDLDLISPGEMYMKRSFFPTVKTHFVRSYQCTDLGFFSKSDEHVVDCMPTGFSSYTGPQYSYPPVSKASVVNVKIEGLDKLENASMSDAQLLDSVRNTRRKNWND